MQVSSWLLFFSARSNILIPNLSRKNGDYDKTFVYYSRFRFFLMRKINNLYDNLVLKVFFSVQ